MQGHFNLFLKQLVHSSNIFSSLKSRNYRYYFAGQGVSLIGSWMHSIAMGWLVYRLTGSTLLLGLIGFTSQIPNFIISPFAGVITDRYKRERIMLLTQVLFFFQALILGIIVLTGIVQIWQIVALSLVFGLISSFDTPARQSMVIDLIDDPQYLGNAIALNSAMFNGARLVGPAIAGMVIAGVGEGICFIINALSYTGIIYVLLSIRFPKTKITKSEESVKEQLKAGFRYTFGNLPIRNLIVLLGVLSLFGNPFITLMPAFTSEILKGGSHTYGFIMSSTGAGAFVGALYLASRKNTNGLGKIISRMAILFGISLILLAFTNGLHFAILMGFFAGLSMISTIASVNTLLQTLTEEKMRGRVMSFYTMALMGMYPFGNLMAGATATAIGISNTLIIAGSSTLIIGIWFALSWSGLKLKTNNQQN